MTQHTVARSRPANGTRLNLALVIALLLTLVLGHPVAAQSEPLDLPAGILPNQQAGCASFDDLTPGATFGPGSTITSGKLSLSVGAARGQGGQAAVQVSSAINPTGNELGIIAILIGLVIGSPEASEVSFSWKVEEGESVLRLNGKLFIVPSFAALDGRTIEGVRVAVGDVNGDGVAELRATGPIQNLAIGGKDLVIDDLCIQGPPQPAAISRDLGDAPDSSNHWGAAMTAYPAVAARFPTVYDPAVLPAGPMHILPRPFHLGASVSRELNADWGPDADGINNILPPIDAKNRDRYDDGVNPALIAFANCVKPTFPVQIFVSPAALASLPNGKGYLNLWVDSNRDGDWEDAGQCTPAGGGNTPAGEHFVIDFQVDAAALGAGLHTVSVTANRAVIWPAALAAQPAWLRATLSEAPSVKLPGQLYGDGRGPVPAFVSGETEDYLWRSAGDPANGPDLLIRKRGVIIARPVPGAQQGDALLDTRVIWVLEYRNVGTQPATSVVITDDLANAGVTPANAFIRSAPALPSTTNGSSVSFNVGTLQPGRGGRILISGALPSTVLPPQLVNIATIVAAADIDLSNNSVSSTARSILPPPRIILPGSGTTNRNQVTFAGTAWLNSTVDLYVDGALVASPPVSNSRWSHTMNLADGDHKAVAIARVGAVSSAPSNLLEITVDSTFSWDPLSLRVVGPGNRTQRPVDDEGRTDAEGWRMWLRPGQQYTVSAALCNNEVVEATFKIGSGPDIPMTDPDNDDRYSATFTAPGAADQEASISVSCQTVAAAGVDVAAQPEAAPRAGGGSANAPGTIRVLDAITRQPITTARILGLPSLGWYGCITCTVASASATDGISVNANGEVGIEDIITSRSGGDVVTFAEIVFTVVQAPGYQRVRDEFSLNFEEMKRIRTILLMPAVPSAPQHLWTISDNDFDDLLTQVAVGDSVRILNLGTTARQMDASTPKLIQSAIVPNGGTEEPDFSTGVLEPGESLDFVVAEAGPYVLTDSENPGVTSTITSVQFSGQPVYLPIVNR